MCRQKCNQRASKALPAQSRTLRGGHFNKVLFHRCRLGLSQAMKDFFVVLPINLCRRTGVFSHFQVGYKWLERSSISPWILTGSSRFWPVRPFRQLRPSPVLCGVGCCGTPSFQLGREGGRGEGEDVAEIMNSGERQLLLSCGGPSQPG